MSLPYCHMYDYWLNPPAVGGISLAWQVSFVETCFFISRKTVNTMKALEEKILHEGTVLPGNILKVGSFLNHQIDASFTMEMGREIARLFANEHVTRILTIETSGLRGCRCPERPNGFCQEEPLQQPLR